MRVLIVGSNYTPTEHARILCDLWVRTNLALNPDCDICILDSASPIAPRRFLPWPGGTIHDDGSTERPTGHSRFIMSYPDNIGHLSRGGRNGAGRAVCGAMHLGMADEYDYVVHTETDFLFARPIMPIVHRLSKHRIDMACPFDAAYQFIETGLMFFDCGWLEESDIASKYDWPNPRSGVLPEVWLEHLAKDVLFTLPLRGCRDDRKLLTIQNLQQSFPFGIDYLTHCHDLRLFHRFLDINKVRPHVGDI